MSAIIDSFFSAINTSFEKSRITSHISAQYQQLSEVTKQMLMLEDGTYSKVKFYKELDREFDRQVKDYKGKPLLFLSHVVEKRLKDNDEILKAVDRIFSDKIHKEGLDYTKVNILSYITATDRFIRYTHAMTNYLVKQMTSDPYDTVDKRDKKEVESEGALKSYAIIVNALYTKFDVLLKDIKQLEGVTYDPATSKAQERMLGSKTDPARLGFLPTPMNPAYWLGLVYNAWYTANYEESKHRLSKLRVRIIHLKQDLNNASSEEKAETQKQIDYYSNLINKLHAEVEEIEEDAVSK